MVVCGGVGERENISIDFIRQGMPNVKLGIRESRIPVHLLNLLTLVNFKKRCTGHRITSAGFERLCDWR
jgi:hypothetical protein